MKKAIAYMTQVVVRTPNDVGALIRSRRRAIGLSQADLASKLGTSRLWITEIEQGKPRASLVLVLRALAALGLELATDDEGTHGDEGQATTYDAATKELRRRLT